jgi:hypothetical protein
MDHFCDRFVTRVGPAQQCSNSTPPSAPLSRGSAVRSTVTGDATAGRLREIVETSQDQQASSTS